MAGGFGNGLAAGDRQQDPARSPRVFFAVELPGALRDRLRRTADEARHVLPGLRPAAAEDLHLTLAFLGEVDPITAAGIERRVRQRLPAFAPFSFSIAGLGVFPDPGHARVLWYGVSDGGALAALAGMVGEVSREAAARGGERFHAHVTIGRFRATPDRAALTALIAAHGGRDLGRMETRAFVLHESRLDGGSPRYRVRAKFELEVAP